MNTAPLIAKNKVFKLTGFQVGQVLIRDGWNRNAFEGISNRWFTADRDYVLPSDTFVQRKFWLWWARNLAHRLGIAFKEIYKLHVSDCDNFAEDFHSNIQLTSRVGGFVSAVASWWFWYPSKVGKHAIDGYCTVRDSKQISVKEFNDNWLDITIARYIEPQNGKLLCLKQSEKRLDLGVL